MSLFLYETEDDLAPLALLRYQCDLIVGAMTLRERVEKMVGVSATVLPRPRAGLLSLDATPRAKPEPDTGPGLYLPANVLLRGPLPLEGPEEVGVCGERVVFLRLGVERAACFAARGATAAAEGLPRRGMESDFITRPWDLIRHLPTVLAEDCSNDSPKRNPSARIHPSAVLDESDGPIVVAAGAIIEPFAYIAGPSWIGPKSVIRAHAAVRACSIGAECRVGGEVTCSIFFPLANKQHDGFLGHSVVGSWVNIGAGATGSNLKNTYGEVRVDGDGTGLNYFGQIIGDHTKIGIQGVMNTGSIYGICSTLVTGSMSIQGGPFPKRVNDFVFTDARADIESTIKTARLAMARRNRELDPVQEAVIRALYVRDVSGME